MEDIESPGITIPVESSSLKIEEKGINSGEVKMKSKCFLSRKKKIGLLLLILVCLSLVIILPILYFMKGETKVEEYKETQYNLLVSSEITVLSGSKSSTTYDKFNVIFFALDMIGDKYRILLTKGSFEEESFNSSSVPLKPDYFIYLELESRTGKILEAKYKKDFYDENSINMLIGITQVFVVDQDSEWEYSTQCKKTGTKTNQCTHNSKKNDGASVMFQRKQSSSDNSDDNAEFEHTSSTWVDKDGKVEKSNIGGWFSKVVDDENKEKINFNVSASVVILSRSKIARDNLDELNYIVEALPVGNQSTSSNRLEAGEYHQIQNTPDDDEPKEIPNLMKPDDRMLADNDDRMLFDQVVSYKYFNFYSIPFYLNSRLYSSTDSNGRAWFCGIHRFEFGGISLKLLKTDFCLSSNLASISSKKKISDWATEGSQTVYLYKQTFSIFTFKLYGKVKINNTPYVQVYYNTKGNTVTNVIVETKISVSVTGEASAGVAKGGLTFSNSMTSNINDYMVGYQYPFSAFVSLDRSLDFTFEIWVKYLKLGSSCYTLFGIKICLPTFKYSSSVTLYKEKFDYKYYQPEFIFSLAF